MANSGAIAGKFGCSRPALCFARSWAGALLSLALLLGSCGMLPATMGPTQYGQQAQTPAHPEGQAGHFAVATAHPLATRAATQMLERGGSAVDALVAASLMLTVVTPQSTGIGGGGFALVAPVQGPVRAFDFRETAPAGTLVQDYLDATGKLVPERSQRHGLAVAVPGYLPGLWELHKRWGKLPWSDTVQPAILAAEQGFEPGQPFFDALTVTWAKLSPQGQETFGQGGKPLPKGGRLYWPKLAKTLGILAADPEAMQRGPIAEDLVESVQSAGGKLTLADLAGYKVRELEPLTGEAFGHQTYTMPQPSAGGAQVLAMAEFLQAWQGQSPRKVPYSLDAPFAAHALVEAMRRSFALRLSFSGDSATPAATLDQVYPREARQALQPWNPRKATPTEELPKLPAGKLEQHANTSHVSIRDGDGLVVSSTHTVNLLFGSGIVATRSGILLNNEMDDFSFNTTDSNAFGLAGSAANLVRPGARPVSSMSPLIVMQGPASQPGAPWLVLGSPGGTRITTTVLQVLFRVAHSGWSLAMAVAAPRLHHQALPDQVFVEAGPQAEEVRAALQELGHKVVVAPPWCNVQALQAVPERGGTLRWQAVADPRGEGTAGAR